MVFQWQAATQADTGYVFSLLLNGARNGHFEPQILSQKTEYRAYIQSAIHLQTDLRGYRTEVLIGWLNQTKVGAVVITEAIGTPDVGVEIAMIAIKAEFRGKGIGSTALDALLHQLLPSSSVYARCFPASHKLERMLITRGFSKVGQLGLATILRHDRFDGMRNSNCSIALQTSGYEQSSLRIK